MISQIQIFDITNFFVISQNRDFIIKRHLIEPRLPASGGLCADVIKQTSGNLKRIDHAFDVRTLPCNFYTCTAVKIVFEQK